MTWPWPAEMARPTTSTSPIEDRRGDHLVPRHPHGQGRLRVTYQGIVEVSVLDREVSTRRAEPRGDHRITRARSGLPAGLDVKCQDVVAECGEARDRDVERDAVVLAVPVVEVGPDGQGLVALRRGGVDAAVGPFA